SARIGLVDRTGIGAGTEVARTAGLDAIAAHLHVPEQRLAQRDGGAPISHIRVELWNSVGTQSFQASRTRIAVREQVLCAGARSLAEVLFGACRQTAKARGQHQATDRELVE